MWDSTNVRASLGCDLVNFDQSFFSEKLILKAEDCCPRENNLKSARNEQTLPILNQH